MQIIGIILILAVLLKIALVLKKSWQYQCAEKKQLQTINKHWQQQKAPAEQLDPPHSWNGLRVFNIVTKINETEDITSFYLTPHDGKALPDFYPGQYLMLHIKHPQQNQSLTRCYSLSDCHSKDYYRISVKKEPFGLASNYLHQQIKVGDTIEATTPSGIFYLDAKPSQPLVLIAGGVGITPLLSMINSLLKAKDDREVYLFYGVSNGSQVMRKSYLQSLSKIHPSFHLHLCYSKPRTEDTDYQHRGRITIELLCSTLAGNNYHYYLCASLSMMKELTAQLKNRGVPENNIHFESFGTKRNPNKIIEETAETFSVFFQKSNKSLDWSVKEGCLLELAEKNAIAIESSCRSGQCGLCKTRISKGKVEYLTEPSFITDKDYCLTCVSIPKDELVLEL